MKKIIITVLIALSLVVVSPVLAKKPAATGEGLAIGETEFPPNTPFHIAHGFAGEPRPDGRYKYMLEWNGEFVKFDLYEIYKDSETETWSWRWIYNFPEGLSGMHTFIHHWYGPCGEGCEQPNKIVEIFRRTQTVNFSIEAVEHAALVALYLNTNGEEWVYNTNWLDENIHHCNWYKVTCDSESNVTELNLYANNLIGSIPPELGNLIKLQVLSLGMNQLTGFIPPELGNLTSLQVLFLDDTQLTGSIPPELGNLADLVFLALYINQLTGSIPPELGNLSNLHSLWLNYNQLTGSIPAELGNLINLQVLALDNNQISGSIPSELKNLSKLGVLKLNNNQLIDCIPGELSQLSGLSSLWLDDNPLEGWETQAALDWALSLTDYLGPDFVAETCP